MIFGWVPAFQSYFVHTSCPGLSNALVNSFVTGTDVRSRRGSCNVQPRAPAGEYSNVSMGLRPGSKLFPRYNRIRVPPTPASINAGAGVESESEERLLSEGKMPVSFLGLRFAVSGRLMLLLVPFLWASYSICVKWLYRLPWAISGSLFNFLRLAVAALFVLPRLVNEMSQVGASRKERIERSHVIMAGTELGFYTLLVNFLQILGLRHTTASRGAFLSQLSTIIVPIAAYATGLEPRLGWNICLAAIMAVIGVGCLTLDNVSSPFTWNGDGLLLGTAVAGTMYILRSKLHAGKGGPLAEMKVVSQSIMALGLLAVEGYVFGNGSLPSLGSIFAGATPVLIAVNAGIILWAGLMVSVGSSTLQIKGQALVSASEAVVIFTFTPLWAAALAIPLGERFGLRGMIGAGLILISTLLASRRTSNGKEKSS